MECKVIAPGKPNEMRTVKNLKQLINDVAIENPTVNSWIVLDYSSNQLKSYQCIRLQDGTIKYRGPKCGNIGKPKLPKKASG